MPYRSAVAPRLADLILQQGQIAAQQRMDQGRIWGGAVQNIGQQVGGMLGQMAQDKADAPRRAMQAEAAQLDLEAKRRAASAAPQQEADAKAARERAQDIQKAQDLAQSAGAILGAPPAEQPKLYADWRAGIIAKGWVAPEAVPETYNPGWLRYKQREGMTVLQQLDADEKARLANAPKLTSVAPGSSLVDENHPGAGPVFTAPDRPKEPTKYKVTVPGPDGGPVEKLFTEEELAGGVKGYRAPVQGPQPTYSWALDPKTNVAVYATPEEIRSKGYTQAATADMRNKDEGRKLVGKSIGAIRDLSKKIITKVGPAQRADALKRGTEAVFGSDPEFRTYQDARMALAGNLAVGQQGSRPSDADIKSIWLPLVPDAYRDTEESANMKWNLIDIMSANDESGASGGGSDAYEEYLKRQNQGGGRAR